MAISSNESGSIREPDASSQESWETPRHGFRGNVPTGMRKRVPASLTVAISREAGSRGSTIGTRAGAKLGWPVYNQELLEYMAQEGATRKEHDDTLSPEAATWVEEQMESALRMAIVGHDSSIGSLARVVLGLAAQGGVVMIGRGAGLFLPRESTLHVRIIAPLSDRIAYMEQWLRLTTEEAAEQVRQRDSRRAEFLATNFRRPGQDLHQYHLILNSSLLGEDLCATLIADAARIKARAMPGESAADEDADTP